MCAGSILRNSILLSSLLFSSEAWYNVTQKQIQDLEMADETLLRKIFAAHSKTPKELLYTESGNVPVSDGEAARVPLVPAARREGEPAQHVLPRAAVQPRQGRLGAHRPGGHRQSGDLNGHGRHYRNFTIKVQINSEKPYRRSNSPSGPGPGPSTSWVTSRQESQTLIAGRVANSQTNSVPQ